MMTHPFPVGARVRVVSLPDTTGEVFAHGVIDDEPVVYVHADGGGNVALTLDRVAPID